MTTGLPSNRFAPWRGTRRALGLLIVLAAGSSGAAPPIRATPSLDPSIAQQCERVYTPSWRPAPGLVNVPVPADERPPKGLPVFDAAHRTCLVRVTDHDAELRSGFARNEYSRRQAFNADDSRLIVVSQDGYWHLYATADLRYLGKLNGPAGDAEPQWHPTDPAVLRYLPNNGIGMTLNEVNVETGQTHVVADLSQRVRAVWPTAQALWTRSEGSPSRDQRYWAFQVDDAKWGGLGLVSYDLKEDRIVATYDFARNRKLRPDHVSMSPSGQYIVVSWLDAVTSFRADFSEPRVIQKKSEHSDLAIGADGDDVYVAVDYEARGGPLFSVNLRTGKRTDLLKTYIDGTATALHISGKAFARPGWVLVSTYADYGKAGQQWLHRKLFAMSLDAEPRILELAHHHSTYAEYFTEPQATVNRNLTRVLFSSNWGTRSKTDVDTFMVVVPDRAYSLAR
ncbi:hypothetical protein [Rhizobacter sp. Root1221]|uniref:hypothetical protein n=1 Tax=Rhizobacter sp. Root1221 TaxID=1736433 RepID=UPI0006FF6109|nr:hypothetical protein [Rhizobacter sp. Root1221]KQV97985.1 hypothetical protein ASC87_22465 [Rhizobacter sp. Root1221]